MSLKENNPRTQLDVSDVFQIGLARPNQTLTTFCVCACVCLCVVPQGAAGSDNAEVGPKGEPGNAGMPVRNLLLGTISQLI